MIIAITPATCSMPKLDISSFSQELSSIDVHSPEAIFVCGKTLEPQIFTAAEYSNMNQ
jgi:hypothetical protein